MQLEVVAEASATLAGTAARRAKADVVAGVLRATPPDLLPVVVPWLAGETRQRRTGLGWAALRDLPPAVAHAELSVEQVDDAFERAQAAAGPGSQSGRRELLRSLLARATPVEQRLLAGLVTGELRQGALEGVLLDAIAVAGQLRGADVRRAVTLSGDVARVAQVALSGGSLDAFRLQVGRPLAPMLAASAPDVDTALGRTGPAGVEQKLDGVRIQVHRDGDDVAVFTRTLDEVTDRVPELVERVLALAPPRLVLDGEVLALRPDGRPLPFQVTSARVARRGDVAAARATTPLTPVVFDLLHLDGDDVLDEPYATRRELLDESLPADLLVPRVVVDAADADRARAFADATLAAGHEGVVVKALGAPYEMGRRGAGWVKVKPRHTLDLVVLAAEWGHGRRTGWLSNLHLGARDPSGAYGPPGGFVMLGKTFKGLTDAMLTEQTQALLALEVHRTRARVDVRPELVVEVAFDGVQSSPRYPAGLALRFARVLHYRPDKRAADADTIDAVRALHEAGLA